MSDFAELSNDGQIAALRLLGEEALKEWGVVPITIDPLVHAENTTFRVESPEGKFSLRISRPGYQATHNIQSEIQFLSDLRKAGFQVPDPFQDRLVTAVHPCVPEARDCLLFRWLEGDFAKPTYTVAQASLVGQSMAKLHDFCQTWTPPVGFHRQTLSSLIPQPQGEELESMALKEDRQLVGEVMAEYRQLASELPRDPKWWGLIHADLHHGNVLFEGDQVKVIDFDDTQWNFWITDFAAALAYVMPFDEFPEKKRQMFAGYTSVRPLPPDTEALLDKFLQFRFASISTWAMSRYDNPFFRTDGHKWVGNLCARIRRLRESTGE